MEKTMNKIKKIIIALYFIVFCIAPALSQDIFSAAAKGEITQIKLLLKAQPELVNEKDGRGGTPLHIAAYRGHNEIIDLLISKGADVNQKDNYGYTPLHLAVLGRKTVSAELLLSKGAHANSKGRNGEILLIAAARIGDMEMIKLLIENSADINACDMNGVTPLLLAVLFGHTEVVRLLVDEGAVTDVKANDGRTLIYRAIEGGNKDIVDMLLPGKEKINNKADEYGRTLIHLAVINGHKEIVELLINHGAKIDVWDNRGNTPLKIAAICGNKEMSEFLIEMGAETTRRSPLEVTYVSNEGFLVSVNGIKILIDALFGWGGTPDDSVKGIMEKIIAGTSPFDGITLTMVTHGHEDHFAPVLVGNHLKNSPETVMICPQETGISLELNYNGFPEIKEQVMACTPGWKTAVQVTANGIRIKVLGLRHSDEPNFEIPHAGYLIMVEGYKIVHLGDALHTIDNFDSFQWLKNEEIDIAFVPEWYLRYPEGKKIIDEYINPKNIVFMHIPPNGEARVLQEADRFKAELPDVTVFKTPMEKKIFN